MERTFLKKTTADDWDSKTAADEIFSKAKNDLRGLIIDSIMTLYRSIEGKDDSVRSINVSDLCEDIFVAVPLKSDCSMEITKLTLHPNCHVYLTDAGGKDWDLSSFDIYDLAIIGDVLDRSCTFRAKGLM